MGIYLNTFGLMYFSFIFYVFYLFYFQSQRYRTSVSAGVAVHNAWIRVQHVHRVYVRQNVVECQFQMRSYLPE